MRISNEEKLMYEVMAAVYDSGIPMNFKGSMVLKACLLEAGFSEDTRHTVDIDGNWYSDIAPTGKQMVDSLQRALREKNIDLDVNLTRMYGEGRSAGFDLTDANTGEIMFSMDVDVNRPAASTRTYEIDGVRFLGVSPSQMIADKLAAVSTDKLFRRVKDVVDLYYLSGVFVPEKTEIMRALENSGRTLGDFNGFLHRTDELRHSYEKFRFAGDVYKPTFEDVYQKVHRYIREFLPGTQD